MQSLQSRGYYFTYDGQLVSNEGEVQVESDRGVRYTLRFGEVVYGTGEAVTAGAEAADADGRARPGGEPLPLHHRRLRPEADSRAPGAAGHLLPAARPRASGPTTTAATRSSSTPTRSGRRRSRRDAAKADELNARFADWYYVIAAEDFEKLRVTRKDLVKAKSS